MKLNTVCRWQDKGVSKIKQTLQDGEEVEENPKRLNTNVTSEHRGSPYGGKDEEKDSAALVALM